MPTPTAGVLDRVVRAEADAAAVTDRDLLRRFADAGDQAAFAALVARHSRMVLGVCRRLLPTVQDAEDACQATFLLLARAARTGRWQPSAANWLYTTARHVAAKARRAAARRARREGRAAVPEAVPALDEMTGRELLAALDEELGKLPARYREPLVLCYLEGLSRDDAAARLGVPAGTVKTRLERGRKRLESALTRRGIGPGLGLLALAVTPAAEASAPRLTASILATVCGSPPAAVATLAQGTAMFGFRRTILAAVLAVAAAGVGIGWGAAGSGAPTPSAAAPAPAPPPRVKREPDDPFRKEVAAARDKAIRFLKDRQTADGTWEPALAIGDQEGGTTGLVALALLEAGVPAADPAVAKAVAYLEKLPPKKTYVVSLQVRALAKADPKRHAGVIQKGADWLLAHAIGWKNGGRLDGWSYPINPIADGSNTHFAVVALHAAAEAGAKVDKTIWAAVRDLYVRTRRRDGWVYTSGNGPLAASTESMTAAALTGLALAAKYEKPTDAAKETFDEGMKALLAPPARKPKSVGYNWLVTAELGRALGAATFTAGDKQAAWYRDGAAKLVKDQNPDGSWLPGTAITDRDPVLSTAFGLYFLGPPGQK